MEAGWYQVAHRVGYFHCFDQNLVIAELQGNAIGITQASGLMPLQFNNKIMVRDFLFSSILTFQTNKLFISTCYGISFKSIYFSQEDIDKVKAEIEKRQNEDLDESEMPKINSPLEAV